MQGDKYTKLTRLLFSGISEISVSLCFVRDSSPESSKDYLNLLTPYEKDQWEAYPTLVRKRSFLIGRYAAKKAISYFLGDTNPEEIEIRTGTFGFPVSYSAFRCLPDITLSHSRSQAVACAFPRELLVGIDLQYIQPRAKEAILSMCTDQEVKLFKAFFTEPILTTILWTIKESLSKAVRCGLLLPFKLLNVCKVDFVFLDKIIVTEFSHFPQFKCYSWVMSERVLSLAIPKKLDLTELLLVLSVLKDELVQKSPRSHRHHSRLEGRLQPPQTAQ